MTGIQTWLGIDFSGDQRQWSAGRASSNIWVATVKGSWGFKLTGLRRVQELKIKDNGPPFERLICLLGKEQFQAAAIDAPFSVPSLFVPRGQHQCLLDAVENIQAPGEPFPKGEQLVSALTGQKSPLNPPKPLRLTEAYWQAKGIPVRSTLWNGPRPGAPMTAACLKLIAGTHRPLWPWVRSQEGVLVEAFPAAQLRVWGCPNNRYNGDNAEAKKRRKIICEELSKRIIISDFKHLLFDSADALDAVICAFAAIAATNGSVASEPQWPAAATEGWISVHA